MTDTVLYEKRGEIAYITLNRPEVHNAINPELDDALFEIWNDFRDDDGVRVAILTGAGEKAFCAGADLKEHTHLLGGGPTLARDLMPRGFAGGITRGQHRIYKPIIAALNGLVLGGGLELAMACDIRIAAEHLQIGSVELRHGFHPGDGGIVRLVNVCGAGIALEMELTGGTIDAQRALQCNMVSKVVPLDQLMETAESVAERILRNPRRAVESAKETILEVIGRPLDDQLKLECFYCYTIMGESYIMENVGKFFEKRNPVHFGTNTSP
jgi:enoyl-CoA hydratase/carnithine racemase